MTGFVYIWRDRKHNKYYVGCHSGDEDDGYVCSSKWMKNAYNARPQDFKRRILARVDKDQLFEEEQKWLNLIQTSELKKRYYNITNICGHWSSDPYYYLSVKKKLSKIVKERFSDGQNHNHYGTIWINDGVNSKKVKTDEEIPDGWKKGLTKEHREKVSSTMNGIPKKTVECPHCGKIGGKPTMVRWHFDNCNRKI